MDLGIAGRTALITGGAGGIGFAAAQALGREGARIAIVDLNAEGARSQASALEAEGIAAIGLGADIIAQAEIANAIAETEARLGGVDILVNNAGFTRDMSIRKMQEEDWDSVVDVILKGTFLCTKAVLPGMVERKWGRVINVSSRAHLGNPGQANYSAAKAGVIGFTKAMALENGRHFITVNAVAPGMIDTAMVRSLAHYETVRENAGKNTPIPRIGEVEDVAGAIAFLASQQASYITGEVLHVTGGRYGIPTPGDETQGFDSPIGLYLDGVYLARASASSFEVADIERIEVLRGPQ
jgi:3-oxoacyl-[acyl-carrier protein] reductase